MLSGAGSLGKVVELSPPIGSRSPFTSAKLRIVGNNSTLSSASPPIEMFGGSARHLNLLTKTHKKGTSLNVDIVGRSLLFSVARATSLTSLVILTPFLCTGSNSRVFRSFGGRSCMSQFLDVSLLDINNLYPKVRKISLKSGSDSKLYPHPHVPLPQSTNTPILRNQ